MSTASIPAPNSLWVFRSEELDPAPRVTFVVDSADAEHVTWSATDGTVGVTSTRIWLTLNRPLPAGAKERRLSELRLYIVALKGRIAALAGQELDAEKVEALANLASELRLSWDLCDWVQRHGD